jgi:hypothetical protein
VGTKVVDKVVENMFMVLVKTMNGHEAVRGVSFLSLVGSLKGKIGMTGAH